MSPAKPKARAGRRRGDMKTTSHARAHRVLRPAMPSAPAVPRVTDRVVAQAATTRLFQAACCIWPASRSAAYQRNEYPSGGNFSDGDAVNEVRSTMRLG